VSPKRYSLARLHGRRPLGDSCGRSSITVGGRWAAARLVVVTAVAVAFIPDTLVTWNESKSTIRHHPTALPRVKTEVEMHTIIMSCYISGKHYKNSQYCRILAPSHTKMQGRILRHFVLLYSVFLFSVFCFLCTGLPRKLTYIQVKNTITPCRNWCRNGVLRANKNCQSSDCLPGHGECAETPQPVMDGGQIFQVEVGEGRVVLPTCRPHNFRQGGVVVEGPCRRHSP
jgi:hypothetical protein